MVRVGRRTLLAGLAALPLASAVGCRRSDARAGWERPLRLAFSPAYAPHDPSGLAAALERRSRLRVEIHATRSAEQTVAEMEARAVDGALSSLFDFLFCRALFHVEPVAQVLRRGGEATQSGELVVRADSDATDVASLAGRTVAFVDGYSVTGFILAAKRLRDAKVEVVPRFSGSHEQALADVRSGAAVAAATFRGASQGFADLRVLATTSAVANEPLFVARTIPVETRLALLGALEGVGAEEAGLLAGVAGVTGFRAPPAGAYEEAEQTVRAAGKSVEDLVPEGWARANEHRRPLWSYAP
jgi:ABC-type phosphate/phosphonate transport system substrate-binding protein